MANRTTQTVVRFSSTFLLPGLEAAEPAGAYRVDHDEQSIDGISWRAWRRVRSFIHLPAIGVQRPTFQLVPINSADLDAALEKDQKNEL